MSGGSSGVQQRSDSSVRQLQAKLRGVASRASDAAEESASCFVCVFWNNVTVLCFE